MAVTVAWRKESFTENAKFSTLAAAEEPAIAAGPKLFRADCIMVFEKLRTVFWSPAGRPIFRIETNSFLWILSFLKMILYPQSVLMSIVITAIAEIYLEIIANMEKKLQNKKWKS